MPVEVHLDGEASSAASTPRTAGRQVGGYITVEDAKPRLVMDAMSNLRRRCCVAAAGDWLPTLRVHRPPT
jgi:hypothetical protein